MAIVRDEAYWLKGTITFLEAQVKGLQYELHVRDIRLAENSKYIAQLEQQVQELKTQATAASDGEQGSAGSTLPAFVKPNTPARRRKKPGRRLGHEPALRPVPAKIDRHQDVPLGTDTARRPLCPDCRSVLVRRRKHRRIVEDLVPAAVEVRTRKGDTHQ